MHGWWLAIEVSSRQTSSSSTWSNEIWHPFCDEYFFEVHVWQTDMKTQLQMTTTNYWNTILDTQTIPSSSASTDTAQLQQRKLSFTAWNSTDEVSTSRYYFFSLKSILPHRHHSPRHTSTIDDFHLFHSWQSLATTKKKTASKISSEINLYCNSRYQNSRTSPSTPNKPNP